MDLSQLIPSSSIKNKIKNSYLFFQKGKLNKDENDNKIMNQLKKEFIHSNKKLSELTGLDISYWK